MTREKLGLFRRGRGLHWHEGRRAFHAGRSVDACPHKPETLPFEDWVDGWNAAYADSQDRGG